MSTYNENLRSNVIATLQTLELDLTKVKSQKNASIFTLYYSQSATVKASEQLVYTEDVMKNKLAVKTQAVNNSNISNNLLSSANQANLYVKQSINNSTVSASNVQIATNAIVKLASELGSIYAIVNANDIGSDIHILTEEARSLINTTAYDAETVSQTAMEASIITSEVSASTVLDKSKANNDLMNTVLKITSDEATATGQQLLTEQSNLATSNTVEKKSEGDYLDITIDYQSTKAAYLATNKGLNFNLLVSNISAVGFMVSFESIKLPFKHLEEIFTAEQKAFPYYPIKNYYLIIVKDAKKSTITISNANNLLNADEIDPIKTSAEHSKGILPVSTTTPNPKRSIILIPVPVDSADKANSVPSSSNSVNQIISYLINYHEMIIDGKGPFTIQDSDGDDIVLGTNYVVFVLGLYTDDYKKKLNCFDDFLSAPSPSFKLTTKLVAVDGKTIKQPDSTLSTQDASSTTSNDANILFENGVLNFKVAENPDIFSLVEYRCIFLSPNDPWTGLFLNKESTLALKQEVESLEAIANTQNDKIQNINEITINANVQFLFNLKIAEQVLSGNYVVATQSTRQSLQPTVSNSTKKKTKDAYSTKTSGENISDGLLFPELEYTIQINADVNDNFGNPLIDGQQYTPVILSYSIADEENLSNFTNNWSGYQNSNPIVFKRSSLKS